MVRFLGLDDFGILVPLIRCFLEVCTNSLDFIEFGVVGSYALDVDDDDEDDFDDMVLYA